LVVLEMNISSADARHATRPFAIDHKSKNSGHCRVSRRVVQKRQGCVCLAEGGPPRRLEQHEKFGLVNRLAGHGARRPTVHEEVVDRVVRAADLSPFYDHGDQ
jgi:hypothetical protein